jgi:hypothetical protein
MICLAVLMRIQPAASHSQFVDEATYNQRFAIQAP